MESHPQEPYAKTPQTIDGRHNEPWKRLNSQAKTSGIQIKIVIDSKTEKAICPFYRKELLEKSLKKQCK